MKRVALLLLPLSVACATLHLGADTGADSPPAAIQRFLDAARRKDLDGMSAMWGTDKGVASKTMSKKELERRELIMIQCLGHEKATLGASSTSEGGRLRVPVELTMGTRKANPMFTVVRGPARQWYVENFELEQLRDAGFCSSNGAGSSKP